MLKDNQDIYSDPIGRAQDLSRMKATWMTSDKTIIGASYALYALGLLSAGAIALPAMLMAFGLRLHRGDQVNPYTLKHVRMIIRGTLFLYIPLMVLIMIAIVISGAFALSDNLNGVLWANFISYAVIALTGLVIWIWAMIKTVQNTVVFIDDAVYGKSTLEIN